MMKFQAIYYRAYLRKHLVYSIGFFILISISFIILSVPSVSALESTSPSAIPGPVALLGGGYVGLYGLYDMYPAVPDNAQIADFINTCGVRAWFARHAQKNCDYIELLPENYSSSKMIFLYRNASGINDSIPFVTLLNESEEFVPADPLPRYLPSYPMGLDPLTYFKIAHHAAVNNIEIMDFIYTYGLWSVEEEPAFTDLPNYEYNYVYVIPEKDQSKKLVFLEHHHSKDMLNDSILWVRMVDKNEKLKPLNTSERLSLGIYINRTWTGYFPRVVLYPGGPVPSPVTLYYTESETSNSTTFDASMGMPATNKASTWDFGLAISTIFASMVAIIVILVSVLGLITLVFRSNWPRKR